MILGLGIRLALVVRTWQRYSVACTSFSQYRRWAMLAECHGLFPGIDTLQYTGCAVPTHELY